MSDSIEPIRTRTFSWQDPMRGAQAAASMSGLEFLQAMNRGELPFPPVMAALGFDHIPPEAEYGKVTFFFDPQEYHYNPIGSVHGGVFATLLDSAMGCAVHSTLSAGVGYTTLEFKVSLMGALRTDTGRVRCVGKTLTVGRQVATAEGRIEDEAGKLYAHATTTCLILRPSPEALRQDQDRRS